MLSRIPFLLAVAFLPAHLQTQSSATYLGSTACKTPAAAAEPDSVYLQNVIPTGHPDSINTPYRGLVTREGWKYVCFENRSWLLFNLNEDPYEGASLAQNNEYRRERQKAIVGLKQWVADTGDKFSIPED